ncbi:hypothetical protein [Noviherbaspirillum sedimenti]|uniref:Uncharacterized protein n=1 Tax=Noviherbaspirillum sedimenti TaxID=2320865 RepID=A0A3A3G5D8_9BURK|nr:hypothetical protein [Noviherbaspirillum sedimenti]RJG03678.1 hypothetical protein D3878_20520 [Noviherbaspirillum sedimenti]
MEKEDAIVLMRQLSDRLTHTWALEDLVSPFAEFMAHMESRVSEEEFAFLGTIGAMIYQRGSSQYDASVQADQLLRKLQRGSEIDET